MTLKLSTAADIAKSAPELVELPFLQNGKKIVIRIRQLNMTELAQAEGGPPAMGPNPDGSRTLSTAETLTAAERFRGLARAGIVEPTFIFDADTPGSPRWDDLSAGNQGAVVMEIYRLSGIGTSKDVEAAKRAAGFPDLPGGAPDGAPADPPVRARAAAA